MFLLNWNDPQTFWLNVTNLVLGILVVICLLGLAGSGACELLARLRKRAALSAELDRDMRQLVEDHAFVAPGFGVPTVDGRARRKGGKAPRK